MTYPKDYADKSYLRQKRDRLLGLGIGVLIFLATGTVVFP